MTAPFPALPEFPRPPEFPQPPEAADTLVHFLSDLFETGVASVVDPLPLAAGQSWREWAQDRLQPAATGRSSTATTVTGIGSAPAAAGAAFAAGAPAKTKNSRPALMGLLEVAHRRLLMELPAAPAASVDLEPLRLDPLVAVEAARRLYQFCQVLAAPQQEKEALRRSFAGEFRPRSFAGLLSAYASWRYLPMVLEQVRQRLTVSSGATPAMQEAERMVCEQIARWPLPLTAVLALEIPPEPAGLALLDSHPVGARFLAEQLLHRALTAPQARLMDWTAENAFNALEGVLGGIAVAGAAERLRNALGEKAVPHLQRWEALLASGELGDSE